MNGCKILLHEPRVVKKHDSDEYTQSMAQQTIPNPIIVFGSSRNRGNTWQAIQTVLQTTDQTIPVMDLTQLQVSHFDYEHKNKADDFFPLAETLTKHNPIILATPIYWYTMSAVMKTFIDRFTDLTTIHKDMGKQLHGKTMALITSYSVHPEGKRDFENVFCKICGYMNMQYAGCFYYYSGKNDAVRRQNPLRARRFVRQILAAEPQ